MLDRVRHVIAEELGVAVDAIRPETVAADVNGWDSVRHTILMIRVESEFGIELPFEQLIEVENVAGLADAVEMTLRAPPSQGAGDD